MSKKTNRNRRQERNQKQTAKSIFIRGFLQSFFIVAILLIAGTIGYQTTMRLWNVPPKEDVKIEVPKPTAVPITAPSVDEVSKNLIFCYDKDTHIISKLVLEIFHCERKQLTYITIPMSTQFTMSDILYKKMISVQPSIPQIFRLSTMARYLEREQVFDYGVLVVEDMLQIDISYYTVLPVELYQAVFEEKNITDGVNAVLISSGKDKGTADEKKSTGSGQSSDRHEIVAEVFKRNYIKTLESITSVEELSTYIEDIYADINSNLSLKEKMNYLESYSRTTLNNVSFTRIAGNDRNSGFVLDDGRLSQQLYELDAY